MTLLAVIAELSVQSLDFVLPSLAMILGELHGQFVVEMRIEFLGIPTFLQLLGQHHDLCLPVLLPSLRPVFIVQEL